VLAVSIYLFCNHAADVLCPHELLYVPRVDVDGVAGRLGRFHGLRTAVLRGFGAPRGEAQDRHEQGCDERGATDHSRSSSEFGFTISTFTTSLGARAR